MCNGMRARAYPSIIIVRLFLCNTVTKPVNKETLTCFDKTMYTGSQRPGQHPDIDAPANPNAFSIHVATQKLSPRGEYDNMR